MIELLVTRTEQHIIKHTDKSWKAIDELCFKSKNLYNYANYIIRQEFINSGNWIHYNQLFQLCKEGVDYRDLGSNVGQQTLRLLDKNWKSFFVAIKDWKKNPQKYLGKPNLPRYKNKNGRCVLGLDNNKFSICDGYIRFSWKPINYLNNTFKTKIPEESKLTQCRFIPKGLYYAMEIVYEIEVPDIPENSERIAAIDLGVNNFATITNNIGLKPIVIKGGVIKSMNQYYNKKKAGIQSELMLKNKSRNSKRLQLFTIKRNFKVKDWMHKASKDVVNYCILYNIDTLVCGYNKAWKQSSVMNKKVNQGFVGIPYDMFINQLKYKCENNGIRFVTVDEAYTSGTSFLDGEEPTKENYDRSRRINRGLFRNKNGVLINADVNGSYQILKKAFPDAFADGIEGVGLHPSLTKVA